MINHQQLYRDMLNAYGMSIQDPVPVLLGWEEEDGTRVLGPDQEDTDHPGVFYFRELPNAQPFRGEASNSGRAPLEKKYLRWGMPIYIRRDPILTNVWVIDGLVPGLADEYQDGLPDNLPEPVQLDAFVPGLLDMTIPASMRVRVFGAPYSVGDQFKYIPTQETGSFNGGVTTTTGSVITVPPGNIFSQYVLVQLNFDTGELSYKRGTAVSSIPSHIQVWLADGGTGNYLPQVDPGHFRCGYVRLIGGMERIIRGVNIWAVQEIITKSSSAEILDTVLTDEDGHILTDENGNILTER